MKIVLPALCCLIFWQSCVTHQILTVDSPVLPRDQSQEFWVENDSFRISYNFSGLNAPLRITFSNKLNKPLGIDWKRSALVINKQSISFAAIPGVLNGWSSGNSINWGAGISSSSQRIRAVASSPSEEEFIPPGAYIVKKVEGITNQSISDGPGSGFSFTRLKMRGESHKVSSARFTADQSPLALQCYLTLMTGNLPSDEIICHHSFFVSEVVRTTASRAYFEQDTTANKFFVAEYKDVNRRYSTGYIMAGGKPVLQNPAVKKDVSQVGTASWK